jgi:hypothetical protein
MRKLLLKALMCCAVLLPLSQAQAAPGRLFGGFAAGKKFKFTVTNVISASASLSGYDATAPVPKGVPKFKKGQTVKFKIAGKGQLSGPGFLLPFKADGGTSNSYMTIVTAKNPKANVGIVYKSGSKPTGVALTFIKATGSGFGTKTTTVSYTLE